MESEETFVQCLTFFFQNANGYLYTSLTDFLNSTSLNLGKRIHAAHHTPLHTFLYYKIAARRSLTVMGARLQRHIDGGISQQGLIFGTYRGKGVHLGMSLTAAHMIAFTDDTASDYNNSPHHGVGLCVLHAVPCQLQAAPHVLLVNLLLIHGAKITIIRLKTKEKAEKLFHSLQEFYLHDAQFALGVATVLGLKEVEFTCSRLGHFHDTAKGILVLAGTF